MVIIIRTFIFTPVVVNGPSMMNTLHNGDVMILDKIGMKLGGIKRFDIVVIQTGKTKIIKRVIGMPGEIISYHDNKLYINGKEVSDNHSNEITYDFEEVKIPDGEYYVLGDNRTDSVDSRILGTIPKNEILGHATFIIYPFNRFGSR
ncbi:signal peptidase I [Faecalibacillus faecis]|uniref:signal peptidase I n=1 Tax=Faecalibacillus faecis TaxID=1982628 RepID=UPI003FD7D598